MQLSRSPDSLFLLHRYEKHYIYYVKQFVVNTYYYDDYLNNITIIIITCTILYYNFT